MPVAQIITAIAAVYSASEQRQATKQQRRAIARERRIQEAQNVRERREAIRQRIIATGEIMNAAANTGTMQSSGVAGGVASLGSRTASNIGFSSQIEQLNQQRLSFLSSAAQHEGNAAVGAAIGSAAGAAGGYEGIAKWFS